MILERIVYLAAAAAAASTVKTKLFFINSVKVLTIEQCVCRAASSPITDNISSSRSLAFTAGAAEQQYQKP